MELIDNINRLLGDDLKQALKPGTRLKVAASCFSGRKEFHIAKLKLKPAAAQHLLQPRLPGAGVKVMAREGTQQPGLLDQG